MDKISITDYRVLCYMKKLDTCFRDEIASKFGQAGLASLDCLADFGFVCMPYAAGLIDFLKGKPEGNQFTSNCMMLTPEGEKALLDYKQNLKSQRREIILKTIPIVISFISLIVSICVAIYK